MDTNLKNTISAMRKDIAELENKQKSIKQVRKNMELIKEQICMGRCWMEIGDGQLWKMTHENSYCPDYTNRKMEEKKSGTLEDLIDKI